MKIPDEIYEAINSNIEKQGFYGYEHVKEKNKERAIFDKISQENDQKLYDIFYNFDEINFL